MRIILSSTLALLIGTGAGLAFPTDEVPTSEAAYLAKVKTAAPEQIVAKASIVMMQDGKPRSLQTGTNGYTCLVDGTGTPLCADEKAGHGGKPSVQSPTRQTKSALSTCWPGIPEPPTTTRISGHRISIGYKPVRM